MKYIKDIREGESVVEHYLCKQKLTLKSRSGKSYLSLKLQDKTGLVDAKVWDITNEIQDFEENQFIKIDAIATLYQSEIQLTVRRIRKSAEGEYVPTDYIPSTEKDIDAMYDEILTYIDTIKNEYIKKLLTQIFLEDEETRRLFTSHSAAKAIHHSYLGGLLEHTLSVVQICDFMSGRYKTVNRDILLASAMLHDIGKTRELSSFPTNEYTDEGQLIGHILIGVDIFTEAVRKMDGFPNEIELLIKHCLISHHGEYEYGSPKLPKTIEAFILHGADNLDAKTKMIEEMVTENGQPGPWVGYQRMLNRNIRKTTV